MPMSNKKPPAARGMKQKNGPPSQCAKCPVRALALFQGIPHEDLDWTQGYREGEFAFPAKKVVYREREQHPYAYTLYSGWVAISKSLPDGKCQIMRFALPGDFIGFQADMSGPMTLAATAITNVELCAFPRSRMMNMFVERPQLGARMAQMNARYMELCQHHLLAAGQRSAIERMAFLMMELFFRVQRVGNMVPGSTEDGIAWPLAQLQIGQAIGLTPVHVSRTLKELRAQGLADIRDHRLIINDMEGMTELSQYDISMEQSEML